MNKECQIVRDLIPLYTEDLVSVGSRAFADRHFESCEQCRRERDAAAERIIQAKNASEVQNRIWQEIKARQKRKNDRIIIIVVLAVTFCYILFLTCPLLLGALGVVEINPEVSFNEGYNSIEEAMSSYEDSIISSDKKIMDRAETSAYSMVQTLCYESEKL